VAIAFGTDGWRGVISDDFTFANAKIMAQAYADYLKKGKAPGERVIVGYDSRFLSREYAHTVAQVLTANRIPVLITEKVTATPVISYLIKHLSLQGGLVITASHNPPQYNGIKVKGWYGGSATGEIMEEIRSCLYRTPVRDSGNNALMDYYQGDKLYIDHIKQFVDLSLIKSSGLKVLIDPMYGAGKGYLKSLLESFEIDVREIHATDNPGFGGINPEPVGKNLVELRRKVIEGKFSVGLATDGDADRLGAVDEHGNNISAQQIFAIILWHWFSKSKNRGAVGKTFSTTKMIDKIAHKFGLGIYETPIGFKHLVTLFLQHKIVIGGEESGGIGINCHLPERDGLLNSLLLLEAMAYHQKTLGQLMEEIMEEIGTHHFLRRDLPLKGWDTTQIMSFIKNYWMSKTLKNDNLLIEELDGFKVTFNSSRWLLFRPSGTEPVMRVYAEAESNEMVKRLLQMGIKLVQRAVTCDRIVPL
jgi:phosphomannomutase